MQDHSRCIIGIDLGTTNSCVAYIDTDAKTNPRLQVRLFQIPQLASHGIVEPKNLLPSFYYLPAAGEFLDGSFQMPWDRNKNPGYFVGVFAREHGAKTPTRLVQSAKSWLCNAAADRKEKILPVEAAEASIRISPVEATAGYLRHIVNAWNEHFAKSDPAMEFQEQEVILTVPASFDEVARMLTVEAAKQAGFSKVSLLEEPQAAFYSWILEHESKWQGFFKEGDCILVCDVGGGTTDFSLIEVRSGETDASLSFQRMAVGNHMLLGGDNMDQAICHFLENKLKSKSSISLDPKQWLQLVSASRDAKEKLLEDQSPEQFTVCIQGAGSQVVSGSLTIELSKKELENLLLNGFFGSYTFEEAVSLVKSSGLRTMGLPYEADPSITKHLASFLQKGQLLKKPDYVLFNGGSMKPLLFRQAILTNLSNWFGGDPPKELPSSSLDLAVSRGAAYFGKARRGLGVRIGGGIPRTYYLVIDVCTPEGETKKQALTLLPRGTQEGVKIESERVFMLKPNAPVSFHLLSSHTRLNDLAGSLVEIKEEEMFPLPPIRTVLRYGKKLASAEAPSEMLPVKVAMELSEIGTLELWLQSERTDHRWRLEFQLRSVSGEDNSLFALEHSRTDVTFGEEELRPAKEFIAEIFSGHSSIPPNKFMGELERILGSSRNEWAPSLLRGLWEALLAQSPSKCISTEHEMRWWNFAGFFLRPGFGYPLDDFRLKELWKIILGDLKKPKTLEGRLQCWICYRRIAGGLNKGQQTQLISDLISETLIQINPPRGSKSKPDANEYAEKIRALAAMELIEVNIKTRLGDALVKRIADGRGVPCDYWALGRLGARHLVRGGLVNVVPKEICSRWIKTLLEAKKAENKQDDVVFLMEQLARKTSFREVNLPETVVNEILAAYSSHPKAKRLRLLLTEDTPLTTQEQDQVYGERLPVGLTLLT